MSSTCFEPEASCICIIENKEMYCSLSVHLIFYQNGKKLNMGFLRDLFWVHYCSTMYINDFPCNINKVSHTILFADDTNILVSSCNLNELNSKLNFVL